MSSLCKLFAAQSYYWRIEPSEQAFLRFGQVLRPEHGLRFENRDRRIEEMKTSIGCQRVRVIFAVACLAAVSTGLPDASAWLYADDKKDEKQENPEEKKKEEQPDAKKKKDAPKPVNPLEELFKRRRQSGQERPAIKLPESPETPANKKPARAAIDPRAPYDKRADDWLRKAVAHIKSGEWKEALELLQKISDLPEDTLYHTEGGKQPPHWVSMRDEG